MISVIIVNYYSAGFIEKAIESILQDSEEVEFIVVDNTATTEEQEELKELHGSKKIHLLFNKKNEGFSKACNQAFSISRGDYILLINPDAFVKPPCLSILRNFIENTPDAGSVSPMVYWDDEMKFFFPHYPLPSPMRDLCSKLSCLSHTFESLFSLYERWRNLKLWKSSTPMEVKNLHGGVVLVRRSSVEKMGGLFDERFFLFYEDTDLFFRLRKTGHKLFTVPAAKAIHNYNHKQQKLDIMARARQLYYGKHFSKSLLLKIVDLIPGYTPKREYCDYGFWDNPVSFSIPQTLRERYLFEWSPSPLFVPAIGFFGSGNTFIFPEQVWGFLDGGTYFSRITDPEKIFPDYTVFYWRKDG